MFVRKRRNKSGTTSVVVVDKSSGRFKELATIGVASSPEEIAGLEGKARRWIERYGGQQSLDFEETAKALEEVCRALSMVERTLQDAPQAILGSVYERIGFDAVVAYKLYKELERTLRLTNMGMSVDKALFIAKTITTLKIRLPNGELYTKTLYNTPQQEKLRPLIEADAFARTREG